jgi:hypothetical protein
MVFAVAVLVLQLAPGALTAPVAPTPSLLTSLNQETAGPSNATPQWSTSASPERESFNLANFSFEKVSLSTTSKESSTAKLSAVSLDSSSDSQTLSTVRVPELQPGKPQEVMMAERRRYTRSWVALSMIQHGAATFDAYSTRQAIARGAVEVDPMMRPFAHSSAIYAAIQGGPVALDFIARRMQRSENDMIRRLWWVPQTVSTATFLFAGVHNMNVTARH